MLNKHGERSVFSLMIMFAEICACLTSYEKAGICLLGFMTHIPVMAFRTGKVSVGIIETE